MTKVFLKKSSFFSSARYASSCKSRKEFVFFYFLHRRSSSFSLAASEHRENTKREKRGKKQINKQVDGRRNLCDKKICLIYFSSLFAALLSPFSLVQSFSWRILYEVTYAKFCGGQKNYRLYESACTKLQLFALMRRCFECGSMFGGQLFGAEKELAGMITCY